ncbi:polysaccharide pyruvyl transferase family protein [Terribacillus saccharophilus]|uniref:polysaccharide pyruvyl transferase family protein n=1 Tax=Terribacillus saccharophilus TaxID=361277 RepID=UPI0038251750
MNILIVNVHSSKNKGDAGIVLSMIDSIMKNIPDANIIVKSRFPEVDKEAYNVETHEAIYNVPVDPKVNKFKKVAYAFKLIRKLYSKTKPSSETKDYEWADVVVSCGGGFLLSHKFSVALLQHLVQLKVAQDFNKKTIIYSQSIGPFYNGFMKKVTRQVLNNVTKIFIREEISKKWLREIKCTNNTVDVVPDTAFCMEALVDKDSKNLLTNYINNKSKRPIVGVTVRDWNFPEVDDTVAHRDKYIESIVKGVIYLENNLGAKVYFMPQVLGPNIFNDDRVITKEILNKLPKSNAELLDYDLNPRVLKYFYSQMDMFIGTRMHSNIFALSSKIPTVAINYEHKTTGIMTMLGLEDYVLDINEITPSDLESTIKLCWENRANYVEQLEGNIISAIADAEKPAKYIKNLKIS